MTKAQLEALVNTLLAPSQPITANGMHKPSMQHVIDELYDAQSRGDVLAGVLAALSFTTGDQVLLIRSGAARLVPFTLFSGVKPAVAYDLGATDQYPSTGGSGAGGAIVAGDMFYTTTVGDLDLGTGAEEIPVKSLLMALVNTPGTDPTKWRVI